MHDWSAFPSVLCYDVLGLAPPLLDAASIQPDTLKLQVVSSREGAAAILSRVQQMATTQESPRWPRVPISHGAHAV